MFRNLIFDWSGTLVDDLGPVIEATNAVLTRYDFAPLDRESFRRRFRLPYRDFYQELLPDVALEELEARFRPAFDQAESKVTVLPHAREKLDWCRKMGIRTFVLTSMDPGAFERQLDEFDLRHHFEATYSGVVDKRDLIHHILQSHQLEPTETAFIGDMTHDVETARHGGITSIAVLTGYNHPEVLATARPDITVPDLKVLRSMLEKQRQTQPSPITYTPMHPSPDTIEIRRLQVSTHIGVPDAERAMTQTLWVTLKLIPSQGFNSLADRIDHTIDYQQVAQEIVALASAKPRKLIETLAVEIADHLLREHPLKAIAVTVEKQILPNTDCVAVHLERSR